MGLLIPPNFGIGFVISVYFGEMVCLEKYWNLNYNCKLGFFNHCLVEKRMQEKELIVRDQSLGAQFP